MHDLELELIAITELGEILLAGEQVLRVEIDLVIQRAFAVHDGVEMVPVHGAPSNSVHFHYGQWRMAPALRLDKRGAWLLQWRMAPALREDKAEPYPTHATTGFRNMPICSISHSITSPGCRYHACGSLLNAATPETVPVDTTSPAL